MSNVISFPQRRAEPSAQPSVYGSGAKTLFVHIRNTTMIVHLAAQHKVAAVDGRVGRS